MSLKPNEFTQNDVPGTSKEGVIFIAEEKIQTDQEFPRIETSPPLHEVLGSVAVQIGNATEAQKAAGQMFVTVRSGRAAYTHSPELFVTDDGTISFGYIMVKSVGVPETVRQHWPDYSSATEPFFYSDQFTRSTGDRQTDLVRKAEFLGLATREDQVADAENSLLLHNLGIKTRIPIAGWRVDTITVGGEERDVSWFQKQNFSGNEIYQSAWGMTCPLRFEDVNDYLSNCTVWSEASNGFEIDVESIDRLLYFLLETAKTDRSQEYQTLYTKWNEIVQGVRLIDLSNRVRILEDVGIALAQTMGRQYHILYSNRLTHGNLHDQNISFFGEFCDNSTVTGNALLEIGAAPENSGDVSGIVLAFTKYAQVTALLKGISAEDTPAYTHATYLNEIKTYWTSYEMFINERYEQDIGAYIRNFEPLLRGDLSDEGHDECTPDQLDSAARKRLRRPQRPL